PPARSSTLPASLFPASTPPVKPLAGSVSTGTHEPSPRASSQQGTRPFVSVNSSITPKDCPARAPGPAGLFFDEPGLLIGTFGAMRRASSDTPSALVIAPYRYAAGQLLVNSYHLAPCLGSVDRRQKRNGARIYARREITGSEVMSLTGPWQ